MGVFQTHAVAHLPHDRPHSRDPLVICTVSQPLLVRPQRFCTRHLPLTLHGSVQKRAVACLPQRFRGGLVFKAHRRLYHSTLGLRGMKKRRRRMPVQGTPQTRILEGKLATSELETSAAGMWVVRVGGEDGELRPWHYIYVYSIESRLIMRVRGRAPS